MRLFPIDSFFIFYRSKNDRRIQHLTDTKTAPKEQLSTYCQKKEPIYWETARECILFGGNTTFIVFANNVTPKVR